MTKMDELNIMSEAIREGLETIQQAEENNTGSLMPEEIDTLMLDTIDDLLIEEIEAYKADKSEQSRDDMLNIIQVRVSILEAMGYYERSN